MRSSLGSLVLVDRQSFDGGEKAESPVEYIAIDWKNY